MPIFNKYNKKGKLVATRQEPLSEANFEQFVKEQGEEKAKIYLEALADFNKELEFCIFVQHKPINYQIRRTTNTVRNMTQDFFHDNQVVLSVGGKFLEASVAKTTNNPT